ncbi:hypothetical protein [Streptomyces colonosanans]|uniref:hypothetical protein n=1 Tax=Streptomyces colonosanans TaxID=1428652 RepID=UPI0015A6FC6B|nr:hypothetical protein [Streptomyces colonosanans]
MPPNPTAVLARQARRDRAVHTFAGPHRTPGAAFDDASGVCESARSGAAPVAEPGSAR